jgi:hypothetical protein
MKNLGVKTIGGGDFTMLKYIAKLNKEELERAVGFEKGRLNSGFMIVALAGDEILTPDDFELGASTRWSGGVIRKDNDGQAIGIETILLEKGQNVIALKEKVSKFFLLREENTPAKVLPNLRHTAGMKYPDAEVLGPGIKSGVPQFKLINAKKFIVIRDEV